MKNSKKVNQGKWISTLSDLAKLTEMQQWEGSNWMAANWGVQAHKFDLEFAKWMFAHKVTLSDFAEFLKDACSNEEVDYDEWYLTYSMMDEETQEIIGFKIPSKAFHYDFNYDKTDEIYAAHGEDCEVIYMTAYEQLTLEDEWKDRHVDFTLGHLNLIKAI